MKISSLTALAVKTDIQKDHNSKFFKVIEVFIGEIPISTIMNSKTGESVTNKQLRSTTHLLANF